MSMDERETGPGPMGWFIAGAATVGLLAFAAKIKKFVPSRAQSFAEDEASGRGRPTMAASPVARRSGHETEDLRGGLLGKLVVLLGSVAFCMVFAMIGLRVWVTTAQTDNLPPLTRLQKTPVIPPGPHLQTDPVAELATLRAQESKLLYGVAYLGDDKTRARIPIEDAMRLMVGKDLGPPP